MNCPCGEPAITRCWELDLALCRAHAGEWLTSEEKGKIDDMIIERLRDLPGLHEVLTPEMHESNRRLRDEVDRHAWRIAEPFIARISRRPGLRERVREAWRTFRGLR